MPENISVKITSATGLSRDVTVAMTGATLREVLKAADVNPDAVNISVDGRPVGDPLNHHLKGGAKIVVTEKVSGS